MLSKISLTKILLAGLLFRLLLVFVSYYHPDLPNHIDWGNRFLILGPSKFYENIFWDVSWPNQPLGTILLFGLMAKLNQIIFSAFWFLNVNISVFPSVIITVLSANLHIWLVKLPFILSDIALAYLIYKTVQDISPTHSRLAAAVFLFNPLTFYNSAVWGQTDSLINLLCLLGFYLTYHKKYFLGPIIFLSSFLFKLSLIIYLPIFLILLFHRRRDFLKYSISVLVFIGICYLLAAPFSVSVGKTPFSWLMYMYENRVLPRQGSMLNGNSFNLWYLLFSFDYGLSEFMQLGPFTARFLGQIISVGFFIPVYLKTLFNSKKLTDYLTSLFFVAFISFTFLTNIHERYLYPIFPIITILVFCPKSFIKPWHYVVLSLIHLLNLYDLWFYPMISFLKWLLLYNNFIIGRILSLVLFVILAKFYVQYLSERHQKN